MRLQLVASTRGILGETAPAPAGIDSTGLDRLGSELRFTAWAVFFLGGYFSLFLNLTRMSRVFRIFCELFPEYLSSK